MTMQNLLAWGVLLVAITAPIVAGQTGSSGVKSPESITAEMKGPELKKATTAISEPNGYEATVNGVTWNLDPSGSKLLIQRASELAGKPFIAKGSYSEGRGSSGTRRVLKLSALEDGQPTREMYLRVTVTGRIRVGVVQVGAETTGTTITANGVTWELNFSESKKATAKECAGKTCVITGSLHHQAGVEVKDRYVVTVESITNPSR
jgi:hypothetical protein